MLLIHSLATFRTFESAGKCRFYRKSPKFRKLNTCESQPIYPIN